MKKTSKKILFFGNERLATGVTTTAPALRALIDNGYEVAAVIVAQNDIGKSRKARKLEVAEVAEEHDIPVLAPANLKKAKDELAAYGAEAAVLIAYGKIVPREIIDIFPRGILNIHPSLLPRHRGSTPIESAILDGDKETGVSLMYLTETLDTGPVYAQSRLVLPKISKQLVADILLEWGVNLLINYLPLLLSGSLPPAIPQLENRATHDKRIAKQDGVIDWKKSAEQLEREIRAYADWPRSRTKIAGKEVVIIRVKLSDKLGVPGTFENDNGKLLAFCKWGALEIESLIPAGKKEMLAKAFLAGHKSL